MSIALFSYCSATKVDMVCWGGLAEPGRLGDKFSPIPLIAARPSPAIEHGCPTAHGGFIRRLREGGGAMVCHVWEHVATKSKTLHGSRRHIRQGPKRLTRLCYGHGV